MRVRAYTEDDIPNLVRYVGDFLHEAPNYKAISYNPAKIEYLLKNNLTNGLFFCQLAVTDNGEITAGLCAHCVSFVFSDEKVCEDLLVFVRAPYRGGNGIHKLIASYSDWARSRRPARILLGVSSGFGNDKFAQLVARHGYVELGRAFVLEDK